MYFLLPIGHDEGDVRRLPWVSFAIIAICLGVHLVVTLPAQGAREEAHAALVAVIEHYQAHPYLEASPALAAALATFRVRIDHDDEPAGDDDETAAQAEARLAREQQRLDALFRHYQDREAKAGKRLGVVPADFRWADLFASIFLHIGWVHLLANLFVFWMCGPPLEDIWGRPFFAAFFLVSGVVAALAWVAMERGGAIPMVGASGAIAGLMGAFAVRFTRARITFFYAYFFFLPMRGLMDFGTFTAPSWVVLGVWFGKELLGMAMAQASGLQGGVAFAAHIGGFLFGAFAAWLIGGSGVEKRYLGAAIERKLEKQLGGRANAELTQAFAAIERGDDAQAWHLLEGALHRRPYDADLALAFWDLAKRLHRRDEAAAPVLRQLKYELRSGDRQLALQRWWELRDQVPPRAVDPELQAHMVEAMVAENVLDEAHAALDQLDPATVAAQPLALQLLWLDAARATDSPILLPLARQLAAQPALPDDDRPRVEAALERGQALDAVRQQKARRLAALIPFADDVAPTQES